MPRLRIASDEEAAALRSQLASERAMHWAQAYTQFPTNMGKLLLSRPAYGGPFLELFHGMRTSLTCESWDGVKRRSC